MDLDANGFSPEGAYLQPSSNATHARSADQSRSCQAAAFDNSDGDDIPATKWSISLTYSRIRPR
jgi:hypothetical protein